MLSPVLSALPVLPYYKPNSCATALLLVPLQMRKPRHRAVKYLAQSHTLKCQNWALCSGSLTPPFLHHTA